MRFKRRYTIGSKKVTNGDWLIEKVKILTKSMSDCVHVINVIM